MLTMILLPGQCGLTYPVDYSSYYSTTIRQFLT